MAKTASKAIGSTMKFWGADPSKKGRQEGYAAADAARATAAKDKAAMEEKAKADAAAKEEENKKKMATSNEESRRSALSNYLSKEGESGGSRRRFLVGAK